VQSPNFTFYLIGMKKRDLAERTSNFADRCINLCTALPTSTIGQHIYSQLMRSSTSVACNYRATNLAQSKATFIAKLSIVLEETDECLYWLQLIERRNLIDSKRFKELKNEALQLVKIFSAIRINARKTSQ
jgi:four helix bundle protein